LEKTHLRFGSVLSAGLQNLGIVSFFAAPRKRGFSHCADRILPVQTAVSAGWFAPDKPNSQYSCGGDSTVAFKAPQGLIPAAVAAADTIPPRLGPNLAKAATLARQEKASATRRAYCSDFQIFDRWRAGRGMSPLPALPESVAAFLADEVERGVRPSTIGRRVAAIRYAHRLAGHAAPTDDERVKATVRGIRRSLGTAARKKAPATAERLIAMALGTGDGLKGLRDRALLLLGFAGAFRRSELVALDCEDIEDCESGLRITIRRGKTDQEGQGRPLPSSAAQSVARSPPCRSGAARPVSAPGRSFGPSARAASSAIGSPIRAWPISSKRMPGASGSIPRNSPATRCARASSPQRPSAAPRSSK